MKITYHGHSTFEIATSKGVMLFDPFITGNPMRKNKDISGIRPDYILATHGHQDHIADVEAIAKQSEAKLISNYEIVTWFGEKGIAGHPLNHGGKVKFDIGTIKYVNAVHTSGLPDGSYGGYPGGFVVWDDGFSFYFAGDTALTLDMKLIPLTCPKLDFAIMPIGDNFTMGYEDALLAAQFVECDKIIGCHYDTFGYIEIDKEAAVKHFADNGKELILMDLESTIEI